MLGYSVSSCRCAMWPSPCSQAVLRAWSDGCQTGNLHAVVRMLLRAGYSAWHGSPTGAQDSSSQHIHKPMACINWRGKMHTRQSQVPQLQSTGLCSQRLDKVMNNSHPVVGDDALGMKLHALRITRALAARRRGRCAHDAEHGMDAEQLWTKQQQEWHVNKHTSLHAPHPMQAPLLAARAPGCAGISGAVQP